MYQTACKASHKKDKEYQHNNHVLVCCDAFQQTCFVAILRHVCENNHVNDQQMEPGGDEETKVGSQLIQDVLERLLCASEPGRTKQCSIDAPFVVNFS